MTLPEALDAARDYLGLTAPEPYRNPRPNYTRPPKPKCRPPEARVMDYLCEVRAISRDALTSYKVGDDGSRIIFPFLLPDGTLAMAKAREAEDGAKPIPTARDCEPVLFGWQAIDPNAREVVITEGEIDTLSLATYGFPAMSVPFGGGGKAKQNWIENEYDRLAQFEKIYIATDMDEPGEQAAAEIASRLGRHRCYRVKLPRKDANACLVDGVSQETIAAAIHSAQSLDPEGLQRAGQFADRTSRLFWPAHEQQEGYTTPYGALFDKIHFRPSEMTLWSGASGSGKSQIISDCVPHWIGEGSRVCVASLEMKPERTLKRMVKQAGGVDRPLQAFFDAILAYLDTGLLLYERVGKASVENLLSVFDYARAKYGCDQFVIDSLMRLGIPRADYNAQEQAVYRLVDWAISNHVHLHLVAHSRKGGKESGVPETEDVMGAMEIGANAFNILTIWRNKQAEEAENQPTMTSEPSAVLNVAKQRNGDYEGKIKLWFSKETYQYFSSVDNRHSPRCFVRDRDKAAA
jgi:twinkle protein